MDKRRVYTIVETAPAGVVDELPYELCELCIRTTIDPIKTALDIVARDDEAECIECGYWIENDQVEIVVWEREPVVGQTVAYRMVGPDYRSSGYGTYEGIVDDEGTPMHRFRDGAIVAYNGRTIAQNAHGFAAGTRTGLVETRVLA